nr:hypothetical protein [Tanacetum cinerariifolium]
MLIPDYQDIIFQDFRYSDGFECYQVIKIGRMDDGDLDTKDIGDLANSTGKKEALQPSDKKRKNCYSSGRVGAKGTDATYSPIEKRKRFHDRSYSQPNTIKHAQQICIPGFQYNYWTRWESPQLLRSKTSKYTYIQCRLSLNVHLYIIFLRTTNAMDPEVPAAYHNLGSPSYQYSMCNATMWYNERSNNAKNDVTPSFALCCQEGKVILPRFSDTPQLLKKLLDYNDPTTSRFKDQIKVYNSIFGFTSFGARIDHSVNSGRGPYTFRINGSNYHRMGSLLPSEGVPLRYAQLYFFYTQNEIKNRMSAFMSKETPETVDQNIVANLI